MGRKELKEKQWLVIKKIEKCKTYKKRKELVKELERLEALGDRAKGLATPTQMLAIFTVGEYKQLSKKLTDVEIAESIGISRASLMEFKRKNGLSKKCRGGKV
ncbi:response regulator [Listeria monocytogenes]|uniref:response regulator n=1 Tax=Listeria monocytogenes TaxID=1639 RepID=UPI000F24DEBE|nr:response regulator [Listeria monocytogenes]EAC7181298.1 response regulator [Listeria monocytogenes]EAD9138909.1 response regulator [Listeria monocytogenes]EAF1189777.1 response regulator [Listeria monocytogenes]EAG7074027.1 response regulator [Listeria monocytogenes]EAK8400059.1 response regulator [Listeria monocytogenes]